MSEQNAQDVNPLQFEDNLKGWGGTRYIEVEFQQFNDRYGFSTRKPPQKVSVFGLENIEASLSGFNPKDKNVEVVERDIVTVWLNNFDNSMVDVYSSPDTKRAIYDRATGSLIDMATFQAMDDISDISVEYLAF